MTTSPEVEALAGGLCPECADHLPAQRCGTLVVRKNGINGSVFLACTRYPACDYTEDLEEAEPEAEGTWGRRYEGM